MEFINKTTLCGIVLSALAALAAGGCGANMGVSTELNSSRAGTKKTEHERKRENLRDIAVKHFNSYIAFLKEDCAKFAEKGAKQKELEKIIRRAYYKEYYLPFVSDLVGEYGEFSNVKGLSIMEGSLLINQKYNEYGLYLKISGEQTAFGIIPMPSLSGKFKKERKEAEVFGEKVKYTRVLLSGGLVKGISDKIGGESGMSDGIISHNVDSYEALYDFYKKKLSQKSFRDENEKMRMRYAIRLFGKMMELPEEEGKRQFVEKFISENESYLATYKLLVDNFGEPDVRDPQILERIECERFLCLANQMYNTKDLNFIKLFFLRKVNDPIIGPQMKKIIAGYGCNDVKEFCELDDSEMGAKTNALYESAVKAYQLLKRKYEEIKYKKKLREGIYFRSA